MNAYAMLAVLAQESDGLTFTDVVGNLPSDPAAIFVYILLIGSGVLIWLGSRNKNDAQRGSK
jgi:hypothetical protein